MKIYIAAPFFNSEQLDFVQDVERELSESGHEFYSPRNDGILQNMLPEERAKQMKRIFDLNCDRLVWADTILALMNWKDVGVVWELGFAFARKKKIVTFATNAERVNVMLQQCADLHFDNFKDFSSWLCFGILPTKKDQRDVY